MVPFNEVWGRSYCRPIEKLVDIMDEYPDEVAYIFSPSCVLLSRCSGCCGDESLHCVPLKTANITMQVRKLSRPITIRHSSHHIRKPRNYPERDRGRSRPYNRNQVPKPVSLSPSTGSVHLGSEPLTGSLPVLIFPLPQILKIPTIGDPSYAEMTFSQDVLCDCR